MVSRFVILCQGRTGSTHLQSLLDSHPEIRCFGELLNPRAPVDRPAFVHAEETEVPRYLERQLNEPHEPVVGFKLPFNQARDRPEAVAFVRGIPKLRVIRLSRENLLALLVSRRMMHETRVSQSLWGDYGDTRVRIELDQVPRVFESMERQEMELDAMADGLPVHRLSYERLISDPDVPAELEDFLGVERLPLRSWFEKLRTRPLPEAIANWDELAAKLRGTRFEGFLSDGP